MNGDSLPLPAPDESASARAGALSAGTVKRGVRGLWLDRFLCAEPGSETWVELPLPGSPFHPARRLASQVEVLRERLPRGLRRRLLLPRRLPMLRDDAFVYDPWRPSTLLYDHLTESRFDPAVLTHVGRLLAAFHDAPLPAGAFPDRPPADPLACLSGPVGLEVRDLKRCLDACPALVLAATRGTDAGAADERRVLHGRASAGAVLLAPGGSQVVALTGPDCWVGPPAHDVGSVLGELAEHCAVARIGGDTAALGGLREAMTALLSGYRPRRALDRDQAIGQAAQRVIGHLAANTLWRARAGLQPAGPREMVTLLAAAETELEGLRARWPEEVRSGRPR